MADPRPRPVPGRRWPARTSLAQIRAAYPDLAADTATGERVGVTGRVIFVRNTGKLCFATLREGGVELQAMLSPDKVGAESLAAWKADVDLGDQVFVAGEVISSRRGELSVLADALADDGQGAAAAAGRAQADERGDPGPAALRRPDRAPRGPPDGADRGRGASVRCARPSTARGFVEVETPVLQSMHGGAAARPFHTHLNAFDLPMSLRIATGAAISSGRSSAESSGSTRSAGLSATRASTPPIPRNSRCSRPTRPTAITTRWPS